MTFSPLVRSSCTAVHHHLKVSWQPHTTFYLGKHLCHPHSSHHRGPPMEEQPTTTVSPTPAPKQSSRPKR